jgi:hypothetical protein
MSNAQVSAVLGTEHRTAIGSVSAAERAALERVPERMTPATRATVLEEVPSLVQPRVEERAKRPSQQPEQNFARALVVPVAQAFPEGEDSGEMLVAPGAAPPAEKKKDKKAKEAEADAPETKRVKQAVRPAAPDGPRRWPWIALVILLLAVGAGAYVYFFGFDLPQF